MKPLVNTLKYIAVAGALLAPAIILAQTTPAPYVPLEPLPFLGTGPYNFPQIMVAFFRIAMLLGAALAVLMLTFGGVQYMTSDVLGQKEAGRERIKNSLLGFLLLLLTYIILNTINPQLIKFNLLFGEVGTIANIPTSGPAPQTGAPPQTSPVTNPNGTPVTNNDAGNIAQFPATFGNSGFYVKFSDGTIQPYRQNNQAECQQAAQINGAQCIPWSR